MPERKIKSKFTIKGEKFSERKSKWWNFGFSFARQWDEVYLWISFYIWGLTIGWINETEIDWDEEEE